MALSDFGQYHTSCRKVQRGGTVLCAVTEKRAVPDICHCIRVVHAQTSHPCALLAAFKPITHNASTDSNTKTSSFHSLFFMLFCACTTLARYFYPLSIPLYTCTTLISYPVLYNYLPCILTSPALLATSCKYFGWPIWLSTHEDTT